MQIDGYLLLQRLDLGFHSSHTIAQLLVCFARILLRLLPSAIAIVHYIYLCFNL